MLRDRSMLAWLLVALLLSTAAVAAGMAEVAAQRTTLARLIDSDRADRGAQLARQEDWGSAAYYAFHLTYDPPSKLAFAALGERDVLAWKHRIRMLALEGQIHEADIGNPELALVGRLDFAAIAAFLLPLLIIVALHDLRARERQAGRHELLMSLTDSGLWALRAGVRGAAIAACLLAPFLIGAALSGVTAGKVAAVSTVVVLHAGFWTVACLMCASLTRPGTVILTGLVTAWWLLAVLLPAGGRALIERAVPVPDGSRITLLQREAVNAAWDQPKEATMTAFTGAYPEWAEHAQVNLPFEWKWYFAFQEVGDRRAASTAAAHRNGIAARDQWAGRIAWLSPPALVDRSLQRLAHTDVAAHLNYLDRVRRFHAELREFHYPLLFREEAFDSRRLVDLPVYEHPSGEEGGTRP